MVDIRPHDTYEYDANSDMNGRPTFSDNMKTIPTKLKASTLSVSTAVNSKLSEATVTMRNTLATTGQSLAQLKEKMNTKTRSKQDSAPPLPPPKDYPSERKPSNENYESQFEDDDEVYDVIELDEVDETNVRLPAVPTNKPVRSYLHTTNVSVPDASDARNKSKKFSYG